MDRKIVYPGQVPLSNDFLTIQRNMMIALAYQGQAWGGTNTVVDGLTCIPTVPASLAVQVTAGSILSLAAVDQTNYGGLPLDVTHQVMQQGILLDTTSLTLTPPATSGQAINYLIQVQFEPSDTDSAVLAYFNSSNPQVPWMGPAGSGTAQYSTRKGIVGVQAKAGVAATAGTQTTPAPDAGWTGLYAVTVANGATALTSTEIAQLSSAPFISVKLPQVPSYVQGGTHSWGTDTGTANAMVTTLSPVPTGYNKMSIFVKKIGSANTGAMTINVNALGAVSIVDADGAALVSAAAPANYLMHLVFDGTSMRFMNAPTSTAVGALTASSGEGVNVNGSAVVALNFPGLTTNNSPGNTDLFGYYNQTDVHHRAMTWASMVAALYTSLPGGLLRITPVTASGTWTRGTNTRHALIIATGGGGGGGGDTTTSGAGGSGAGAGATSWAYLDVTSIASVTVTIGAGGAGGNSGDGTAGGTTSFGSYAVAGGGAGGYGSATLSAGTSYILPAGGTATVGAVLIPGGYGGNPSVPGGIAYGGTGGASFWGGGGAGVHNTSTGSLAGGAGSFGGGGGGGNKGAGYGVGGAGGNGFVLVLEFS